MSIISHVVFIAFSCVTTVLTEGEREMAQFKPPNKAYEPASHDSQYPRIRMQPRL
jgi:hypothetical protein